MKRRIGDRGRARSAVRALGAAWLLAGGTPSSADESIDAEIEAELARQEEIGRVQAEIDAELRRQQELERARERAHSEDLIARGSAGGDLAERADPRIAPKAPADRKLPTAIFDSEQIEIPAGQWDNAAPLTVVKRSLDADRDGQPELVRYVDPLSSEMIRQEADLDYDGAIDSWHQYAGGALVVRTLDANHDGRVDTWERYRSGRMIERVIDRNGDGSRDAFYTFSEGSLVEEKHDRNDDGRADLIIRYQDRRKVQSEEDRNGDGRIDTWTRYEVVAGKELPSRVERDTQAKGRIDLIESFDTASGKPVLAKREEDSNGDGAIDVTSTYRNGKLQRRELADPALASD